MPYTIAIAGKGGTGKTTLAGLVVRHLLKVGKTPILAVDADPNANLNEALGVTFDRTVVSTVDAFMGDKEKMPAGVPKGRYLEYEVNDALVESKGFDLLVMGYTEGPGCYCYANDLLKGFLGKLSRGYPYIVMDNEAGMEHLSRRTTRDVDVLLIVAMPTLVSLRSAKRIYEMARRLELGAEKVFLVINDLSRSPGADKPEAIEEVGLPLVGRVPYDEEVAARSVEGGALLDLPEDLPAVKAVGEIMSKCW